MSLEPFPPADPNAQPEAAELDGALAPWFTTGTVPHALVALDELGRPLAGVYVPERLLL